MAINDRFMLPRRVRTMAQMAELLDAEQAELARTQHAIQALENQLNISTSTFLLSRHEKIFGLRINTGESLDARRAKILSKLEGISPATPRTICSVVRRFLPEANISVLERNPDYFFEIICTEVTRDPVISDLQGALDEIKPAHLCYSLTFAAIPIEKTIYMAGADARISSSTPMERSVNYRHRAVLSYAGISAMITETRMPAKKEPAPNFIV